MNQTANQNCQTHLLIREYNKLKCLVYYMAKVRGRPRTANTRAKYGKMQGQKSYISRSLVPKGRQVHHHIRWESVDSKIDLTGTASEVNLAKQFQVNLLQNISDLSSLYDQYRITKVVAYLDWSPLDGAAQAFSQAENMYSPIVMFIRDYDDSNILTTAEMKERATTRQFRMRPGITKKIALTPAVLQEIYRSGSTAAYAPKWKQKLDMANLDVPHYGLKFSVSNLNTANLGKITIRFKYYVSCYNTR